MSTDDLERQENELLALESIYGEEQFIHSTATNGGQLSITVNTPCNFKVIDGFSKEVETRDRPSSDSKEVKVQYLPPIVLNFTLPEDYPSRLPPNYTLSCKWLNVIYVSTICDVLQEKGTSQDIDVKNQLTKLCCILDATWNEQGPGEVLFEWAQILADDTLNVLNINNEFSLSLVPLKYARQSSIDSRAHQDVASLSSLVTYLIDYDIKTSQEQFEKSHFTCNVCFNEKLGKDGAVFPKCKHVYCNECMADYFKVQIADGSVRALTCPENKCETQADPGLVKKLVPADVFAKYDKFLLQSTLECMNEITYCPRIDCQSPVLQEPEDNLATCPVCTFVFCVLCKRSYHGVANCPINASELRKLRTEYLNGTTEEKDMLEKRYGEKKLQQAVEEHYSEAWLDTFSKKCPSCNTSIQKIDGCNKMQCFKCRKNFCWLCLKVLSGDPYIHFNNSTTGCYGKLFEGITLDEFSDSEDEDDWVNLVNRLG